MPRKSAKIDCKAKALGGHGVMFKLKTDIPGFGRVKCDLHYELDSDSMTTLVLTKATEAEAVLDGMAVDPTDVESISQYAAACGEALNGLMIAVQQELSE